MVYMHLPISFLSSRKYLTNQVRLAKRFPSHTSSVRPPFFLKVKMLRPMTRNLRRNVNGCSSTCNEQVRPSSKEQTTTKTMVHAKTASNVVVVLPHTVSCVPFGFIEIFVGKPDPHPQDKMIQCPETHLFCMNCMRSYASTLLGTHDPNIKCMDQSGCKALIPYSELRRFLPEKLMALYERVKQRKEVEAAGLDGLEECPFCEWGCVIENPEEKLLRCENTDACGAVSCRQCKKLVCLLYTVAISLIIWDRIISRNAVKVRNGWSKSYDYDD